MEETVETYELFVYITKGDGKYQWGIGQELELEEGRTDFEFLAGGEEDEFAEASHRISEEIKVLFKEV